MDASQLLGRLARALASIDPEVPMPDRLCRACVEILGAQSGALTVSSADEHLTISSKDGLSAQIDDLEDVVGEGPGRVAFTENRMVTVELDRNDRSTEAFPVFSQLAQSITGPATLVAVPVHVGARAIGVLNLYFTTGRLTYPEADLQMLADLIGLSLVNELDSLDWSSRSLIHQATGMVTAQLRIPLPDALAILRAHAFAGSTTLETVADDVVQRRIAFVRDPSNVVRTVTTDDSGH